MGYWMYCEDEEDEREPTPEEIAEDAEKEARQKEAIAAFWAAHPELAKGLSEVMGKAIDRSRADAVRLLQV